MAKCCNDKIELEAEEKRLTEKLKLLKQDYQKLLIENLQKDLILRQITLRKEKNKFSSFGEHLSKTCIEKLNVIGVSQREDSSFVSVVLYELYGNDNEAIQKLSLSGRSKSGVKTELTVEKRKILESIFAERLSYIQSADKSRKINLNKLIRNAVDNAKRKQCLPLFICEQFKENGERFVFIFYFVFYISSF